ncbi:hypothetical protein X740_04480 [Mesorhizobium sp. LNHC221B00]|uniref:DUF1515 family protein n=1 Tax=Mesorhizobium sp. LNHC221B00 TaxID=1287233 RepID=UPI0003CE4917|nr:DUF1515 family protein [Mesorhizobium sp. LNHC221B00]ESY82052.1 hypothetical protein X740_04480 [Mesorhizobium sp. LNHC221B00]
MAATGVERTLGILLAKVEGIEKSIQLGDQHRATVHRRVDELVEDLSEVRINVAGITVDVASMKSDVADTKMVTDEVTRWKLMGLGALGVTGIAAGAVASTITYYWHDIWRALRGM